MATARSFNAGDGPNFIALGDFNGDGKLDIVTSNYVIPYIPRNSDIFGNEVRVFLGNGDGTFQAAHIYKAGTQPGAVAVGDFNGDSIPDLAVANGPFYTKGGPSVSVLLGNGDGTFQAALNYQAGGNPLSVAVGDFNGDGYPDLAVANNVIPGFVTILINDAAWHR